MNEGTGNVSKRNGLISEITEANLQYIADRIGTKVPEHINNTDIHVTTDEKAAWNAKQDKLTFDDAPAAESGNPVKSGGVYAALDTKADKATTLSAYGITDAYTKTEVNTALNKKAGKATTLAGYGITDAYTKTETDATFALTENAVINISKRYICSSTDGSVSSLDLSSSADIPLFNINGLDNGALPDDISSICQGIFKFRYIYPEVYTDITVMQQLMYADSASGSYIFVCTAFEKGRIYSRRVDADKDTGTGEFVFTYGKWNCIDGGDKADKSDVYTKTETDTALEAKADKATTLIGYGITDAYTKTEADTVLEAKADKATTLAGYGITDAYTKNEAEAALATKADKTAITASTDGSITLADNTEFRVADTVTSISLTIPDDIPNDFISSVVFKSGTEAMAIDYSAVSPIWRGDDVTDGVFIPLANKVYNVIFYNDGFNITAVAGGYDI